MQFNAMAAASQAREPLLPLVAADDNIVPVAHSRRLVDAWGGAHTLREVAGADHNDISGAESYLQLIGGFLAKARDSH